MPLIVVAAMAYLLLGSPMLAILIVAVFVPSLIKEAISAPK